MDRTSKLLLAAIALGLWANAVIPLFRPHGVAAQDRTAHTLSSIDDHLATIEHDVHDLTDIGDGTCTNDAICK